MAKHFKPKQRRARKAALAGAAAAGVSGALVLGTTTGATVSYDVNLAAATTIGVGGRDDPNADRVQNKLQGFFKVPDDQYVRVVYPATVAFQDSIDVGIPELQNKIDNTPGTIRVVSFSEGTLVAEQVKRDLAASGYPKTIDFVFMASPYSPNGGIFARFPGFQIPGLLPEFSAAQPTKYDSIYVTNEYDGFADFPAYFNPLSIANALAGMAYAHPDQYYEAIDLDDLVEGEGKYTTVVTNNGANGTDTYIFVKNEHLPLLAPIRQIAAATQLTPLTEPVLSAIEPVLRVGVDAGYTDRTNATPGKPTPFSFITPPAKIVEAVTQVPGALEEGLGDATDGQTLIPSNRAPSTTNQNRALLDANEAPRKLPKKPVTKKDPFKTVSSAIKKGLQSTQNALKPLSGRTPSTTEVKQDKEPTAPKSESDAA